MSGTTTREISARGPRHQLNDQVDDGGGMDIGSLIAQVAGGGVGGGILLVLVGLIRQMLGGGGQAARS